MFYQIFHSPQMRQWTIFTYKNDFPANMKTSWRRLSSSFSSSRRLNQNENIRLSHTSSRRLGQEQYNHLGHTSSRRLQNVFKTSSRRPAKTSSRHLQDVLPRRLPKTSYIKTFSRRFQHVVKTYPRGLTKMSSKRFQDVSSI